MSYNELITLLKSVYALYADAGELIQYLHALRMCVDLTLNQGVFCLLNKPSGNKQYVGFVYRL